VPPHGMRSSQPGEEVVGKAIDEAATPREIDVGEVLANRHDHARRNTVSRSGLRSTSESPVWPGRRVRSRTGRRRLLGSAPTSRRAPHRCLIRRRTHREVRPSRDRRAQLRGGVGTHDSTGSVSLPARRCRAQLASHCCIPLEIHDQPVLTHPGRAASRRQCDDAHLRRLLASIRSRGWSTHDRG